MAIYTHGNLAREEQINNRTKVKFREVKRKVYRTRAITAQEKLLYLFTVLLCVVVAGAIIWRYSQIYEMNTSIHNIEVTIQQLQTENDNLKQQVSRISDPATLQKEAESEGYAFVDPNKISHINNQATLGEPSNQQLAYKSNN